MASYLEGYDLWEYVDGTIPRPPSPGEPGYLGDNAGSSNWRVWKLNDSYCKNILRSNVHRDVLSLFTPCNTASDLWQVLKETYQMDNPQSFANLKSALEHCKMQKSQSLEEYIKSHEQLVYQHAAVGKPILEMERIVSFLGGLPDRFDTLRTMYMSIAGLSYKNIVIGLRSFEASKLKPLERTDKGAKGAQAFAAKGSKPKTKKSFKKKDPCTRCGFSNHKTEDCKVDLTTLTCLKCEKKGHSIYLCKAKLVSPGENASVAVGVESDVIVETSMMAELVEVINCNP